MSERPSFEELIQKVKQLEKSNNIYRSFEKNSPDLYYRTDLDGKIVYISPAVYNLTGFTVKEAIGMKMAEEIYLIPDQRVLFLEKLQKDGQVINFEAQFKKKDGSTWWAATNAHFYKDETETILGVEGVTRNITSLKVANKALKESEERFRLAFSTIPDSINLNRASDGVYIDINEGFTDLTGYTRGDVIGKPSLDINIWKNPDDRKRLIEGLMTAGHVKNIEAQFVRKNGEVGVGLMSARILDINNEDVIQSITRDITDQVQAEKAQLKANRMLRLILDTIPVRVFWKDRESKYMGSNQAFADDTGLASPDDLIGRTDYDFAFTAQAELYRIDDNEVMNSGKPKLFYEEVQDRPDGLTNWLLTSKVPIRDDQGNIIGLLGAYQDITDRKQLEAQLQQTQKMEAIGTLAGGIAHDFNNILSGIFGYSHLAQTHIQNPEKANKHIEQIIKGSQRATELTRQILTFSRQSEYQKQPFKIYLEISEALKLLRSSIPSTIKIQTRLDSKKMVLADPIRIHQLIMNLCTNAFHAMRKTGGCLTVSLTDIEIAGSKFLKDKMKNPEEYIKLEVSDTGHGMDTKTLKRVFDPYFTTRMKGDGTGLGLALVQAIVEEHDGFLEVNSKLKKGTNFYLYFPVAKEEIKEKIPEAEGMLKMTGNESIMIVDDEEPIRESCKEFIENYGYHVQTFSNGIEAFETFQTNPAKFDLIVTDMTMPGLTGDKLASKILKIQPDIPIVLCTGFNENITQKKAIALGINQFIQKPLLSQDLLGLIRRILDDKSGKAHP